MDFFHGTTPKNAESILTNGVDVDHPKLSDVGDFGYGIYLTRHLNRAKCYGSPSVVLVISVDLSMFAKVRNPYFIDKFEDVKPQTKEEHLLYSLLFNSEDNNMSTLQGSDDSMIIAAMKIRDAFLKEGFAGITTELKDKETVIFDDRAVTGVMLADGSRSKKGSRYIEDKIAP